MQVGLGLVKIAFFDRSKSSLHLGRLTAQNLLSILLGGSCPRRCAGGGIRGVFNNFGGNRRVLLTVTVQLISTRLVVWKSVGDTSALHVCDMEHRVFGGTVRRAIVQLTTTMRVPNNAGSGIKRGSC